QDLQSLERPHVVFGNQPIRLVDAGRLHEPRERAGIQAQPARGFGRGGGRSDRTREEAPDMATDEAFCSLRVDEGIDAHTATEEEPDEPDPLHVLAAKRLVALATDETERPPLAQRLRGRTAPAGELVERQAIR